LGKKLSICDSGRVTPCVRLGEDFRPDFRQINEVRSQFPKEMKMFEITATSKISHREITSLLGKKDYIQLNITPVFNSNVKVNVLDRSPCKQVDFILYKRLSTLYLNHCCSISYCEEDYFPLTIALNCSGVGIE
jgi:superfamily II DNA helicase RecQ